MTTSAPPRPILSGIQLLRGLAATMVVLSHTNTMMSHPEFFGRSPFGFRLTGEFGVTAFFVISGFIIAYVSLNAQLERRLSPRAFAWRRAVRILPFMWLCVVGYNLLSLVGTHQLEWAPMLRALVLWPVGELKPNVLWSLRHEWLFYLLFALAMLGARRRPAILALWFASPLVLGALLSIDTAPGGWAPGGWAEFARMALLGGQNGANLQFAAGFALGVLRLRGHRSVAPRLRGGAPLLIGVLAASTLFVEAYPIAGFLPRALVWTALATLIGWLALAAVPAKGALLRIGNVLGDASFSIYLVHNAAVLVQFALARRFASGVPLEGLYPVMVAVAVAAGIAVHYLVEAPLIRVLSHGRPIVPWPQGWRRRRSARQ